MKEYKYRRFLHPISIRLRIMLFALLALLALQLSQCTNYYNLPELSAPNSKASSNGVNMALKDNAKGVLYYMCLRPTWFGENTKYFKCKDCDGKLSNELEKFGITQTYQSIDAHTKNNYDINYWIAYKATMDSLIIDAYGSSFIDSLCLEAEKITQSE